MKHKLTDFCCLVYHTKNGKPVPSCRKCDICWEFIEYDKVDEECPGPKKGTLSELMTYTESFENEFKK